MLKPNKLEQKILTKFGYGHGNKTKFTNPEACLVGAASIDALVTHMNFNLGKTRLDFEQNPEKYEHKNFGHHLNFFQDYLLAVLEDEGFIEIGMHRAIDLLELHKDRQELPELKCALKFLEELPIEASISNAINNIKKEINRLEYEDQDDGHQ